MWVLIGFQYVGKSTLAQRWAQRGQRRWVDTDRLIEQVHHQTHAHDHVHNQDLKLLSTRAIHQQLGEFSFRALEQRVILSLPVDGALIATGGGSVLRSENVQALRAHGPLLFLSAPAECLYERALALQDTRYRNFQHFLQHHQARERIYQQCADDCLDMMDEQAIGRFIALERA